jgi:DNA polymerase-3 subunit epsilon
MDLSRLSYVVVDVETTGGSPFAGHRVTEIAAVVVQEGKIVEIYEQLVNPEQYIPPYISQLTGITDDMVWGQPRFADIADRIVELLTGNIFVAHNAAFDWRFVSAELERAFDQKSPRALTLCTVRLARALLPQLPRKSLDYVAHHYGVLDIAQSYTLKRNTRHSAAGDAIITAHCLLKLLDDAANRGITTWKDLQRLAAPKASRKTRRWTALPTSTLDDRTA